MATSTFRNKNLVRPKKHGAAKRRRVLEQRRRLVTLGVPEVQAAAMTPKRMRELLRHPVKTVQAFS